MAKAEQLITLTLYAGSRNFGADRATLAARLAKVGEQPDADGGYTIKQLTHALYSDFDAERLRKTKEEADKLELENRRRRGELVEVEEAIELVQRFAFAIRQKIMLSKMDNADKAATLLDIHALRDVDFSDIQVTDDEGNQATP